MSVKEFFAFGSIKQTVVEFLKVRADFNLLDRKFKKSFRAHINKHSSLQQASASHPLNNQTNFLDQKDDQLLDYFVSDGFHSVKCVFSDTCRQLFESTYPESVKISSIINMLVCVPNFRIELRAPYTQGNQGQQEGVD